ncbi:MAG: dihydrodipicolinate synthase family protein [Chloroflexi bacterium]|nr:dihydrodipicolinate synthase family protein [Chloroflexota bacterium]
MFAPEGVYVAMLTPFDEDGQINEDVLRQTVDFYVAKGVTGLFPISSVGEFIHLSADERKRLIDVVVDQAAGRVDVVPGVGDSCTRNVISHARFAREMGCQAVVVCGPYYLRPSQAVVRRHFETIAEAVELPVILYNIPVFASELSEDTVEYLSRLPNVVGMKDSSGSALYMANVLDRVRLAGSSFNFLTGLEQIMYPSMAMGAKGCMGGTTAVVPEAMVALYRSFQRGDLERAKDLQFSVLKLARAMMAQEFPLGFKLALQTRGFEVGPPKQPLTREQQRTCQAVSPELEKLVAEIVETVAVV